MEKPALKQAGSCAKMEEHTKAGGGKMEQFHLTLDYYGALNLHKALLEAKFHLSPDNELVSGSPLIARIYIQIRDFLLKSEESEAWKAWFQLKNRPDYRERAILRMRNCKRWNKAAFDEKSVIAAAYLSPFLYNEAERNAVILEADGEPYRQHQTGDPG